MKTPSILLLLAAFAFFAVPAFAQHTSLQGLATGTFVELSPGDWRVFPEPAGAFAANDRGFRMLSRRGGAALEVVLPDDWRVSAGDAVSTRFHLLRTTTGRELSGARTLNFSAPDGDSSLSLRMLAGAKAELRWKGAAVSESGGPRLRLEGGHDSGALRKQLLTATSEARSRWVEGQDGWLRLAAGEAGPGSPLVQELIFGTFFGGNASDGITDLTTDAAGNLIIGAVTRSLDFSATPGVFDSLPDTKSDSVIACLSRDGSELRFATFFGGSARDTLWQIAVDADGSYVIAGSTESVDLPVSPNAFDPTWNGATEDSFVARISADGTSLLGCTYIGGTTPGNDEIDHLSIDPTDGSIIVTGDTCSADWPTTPGSLVPTPPATCNGVVSRLAADLSTLEASTYIGGTRFTSINGLTTLSDGSVVISGATDDSPAFPITLLHQGPFRTADSSDPGYLIRLTPALDGVIWSTWSQGVFEQIHERADGALVLVGATFDDTYPTTPGAYSSEFSGTPFNDIELVVSAITPDATTMLWSTYITAGGTVFGSAASALDDEGRVFFCGALATLDYPFTPDAFDTTFTGLSEMHLTVLDATGSQILYASLLGVGAGPQSALGALALDDCGGAFVAAKSYTSASPVTPGSFDETYNGGLDDAWIIRITALNPWQDLGASLGGIKGRPELATSGPLCAGDPTSVDLIKGPDNGMAFLVLGVSELAASFKGGTLIPAPDFIKTVTLDSNGARELDFGWPAGTPSGMQLWLQAWLPDAAGALGWSASNGVLATVP